MSALRKAAQQALKALEEYQYRGAPFLACDGAVAALRAALAQQEEPVEPVREPVAWIHTDLDKPRVKFLEWSEDEPGYRGRWIKTPLYAAPPRCPNCASLEAQNTELDRRLTELEQPVQEPVAKVELMTTGGNAGLATRIVEIDDHLRERLRPGQLLYLAPPQRKPLTQEEIRRIIACIDKFTPVREGMRQLARAIERAHGIGEQP